MKAPSLQRACLAQTKSIGAKKMKTALGLIGVEGFPFQLSPLKIKRALPIPAVDFTEAAPSLAKIFNEDKRIYATPDEFFVFKISQHIPTNQAHTHGIC